MFIHHLHIVPFLRRYGYALQKSDGIYVTAYHVNFLTPIKLNQT